MPASILVVDDENTITGGLELLLSEHGYDVIVASTAAEAETLLARRWFDLIFPTATELSYSNTSNSRLLKSRWC